MITEPVEIVYLMCGKAKFDDYQSHIFTKYSVTRNWNYSTSPSDEVQDPHPTT
jgi:hypothetical protein